VDLAEVETFLPGSGNRRLGWYAGRFAPVDLEEVSTKKRKKRTSRKKVTLITPPRRRQGVPCSVTHPVPRGAGGFVAEDLSAHWQKASLPHRIPWKGRPRHPSAARSA
jgi:hypothetical protein